SRARLVFHTVPPRSVRNRQGHTVLAGRVSLSETASQGDGKQVPTKTSDLPCFSSIPGVVGRPTCLKLVPFVRNTEVRCCRNFRYSVHIDRVIQRHLRCRATCELLAKGFAGWPSHSECEARSACLFYTFVTLSP